MEGLNKHKDREDHLAPTDIGQENTPDGVKAEKYLSDKEVQDRLDLYSNGSQKQFFKVQKIKNKYIKKVRNEEAKRSQADLHYAMGQRAGLPHTHHSIIKDSRELIDQNFRDEIVQEAKAEYKQHENLTKLFDREKKGSKEIPLPSNINEQKSLSKYFKAQKPSLEKMDKTQEQIKGKNMDREK